jgi:hypothetical protein
MYKKILSLLLLLSFLGYAQGVAAAAAQRELKDDFVTLSILSKGIPYKEKAARHGRDFLKMAIEEVLEAYFGGALKGKLSEQLKEVGLNGVQQKLLIMGDTRSFLKEYLGLFASEMALYSLNNDPFTYTGENKQEGVYGEPLLIEYENFRGAKVQVTDYGFMFGLLHNLTVLHGLLKDRHTFDLGKSRIFSSVQIEIEENFKGAKTRIDDTYKSVLDLLAQEISEKHRMAQHRDRYSKKSFEDWVKHQATKEQLERIILQKMGDSDFEKLANEGFWKPAY